MSTITEVLENYVKETIKQIVDNPEEVDIKIVISTKSVIVQIKVAKSDCGKVIGKKGRIVEALKTIVLAIKSSKFPDDTRKVLIEVLEDESIGFNYTKSTGGDDNVN